MTRSTFTSRVIRRFLTHPSFYGLITQTERRELGLLPTRACDVSRLATSAALPDTPEWPEIEARAGLSERRGMVNRGDQRAIYALGKNAHSILEIGTHLGGSTVMFALATTGHITTVDLLDVNGPAGAYRELGGESPRALLERVGVSDRVTFVTSASVDFLERSRETFDLIFLDGGHYAELVYQEIPLALQRLNPGGLILLHDVCPNCQPLWAEELTIPGPWLAYERLKREGARIRMQPLGELPWPTKHGGNITSLAFLLRDG